MNRYDFSAVPDRNSRSTWTVVLGGRIGFGAVGRSLSHFDVMAKPRSDLVELVRLPERFGMRTGELVSFSLSPEFASRRLSKTPSACGIRTTGKLNYRFGSLSARAIIQR